MMTFTPTQARAVVAAARQIEQHGPSLLQAAASISGTALALVPARHRRTVALALAEMALRHAAAPTTPSTANDRNRA